MYTGKIEPFYFGTTNKQLFGCYHEPKSGPSRDCGVVFCYPMGHEYIQFHRVYRQLAIQLSNVGIPVLRFDYYGCGDSGGNCEQGQISQWLSDVSTAIDEMRRRYCVERICLVGLRLGGTLSVMVGAGREDIDGMILWDPVVEGERDIRELESSHLDMLRYAHVKTNQHISDNKHLEILGFPMTDSMIADIKNIDVLTTQQRPARNILMIESNEKAGQGRFREHLESIKAQVEYQCIPSPQLWIWVEAFSKVQVPYQILMVINTWISKVYA